MRHSLIHLTLFICGCLLLAACQSPTPPAPTLPTQGANLAQEYPVQLISLEGPLSKPQAELSGLAWYGDNLLLLPQYPERFVQSGAPDSYGALFTLPKSEVLAYLDGKNNAALSPRPIPFFAPDLKQKVSGFEGFESVVVSGNRIFLTIETHQNSGSMLAVLISGTIAPDLSEIRLDTTRLANIPAQAPIPNFSDEAITLIGDHLLTFYEGNGANVTPKPVGHQFDLDINPQGTLAIPNLEYRITDATPLDSGGQFWVINYFYPGDTKIAPTVDPLFERYGKPPSHSQSKAVERLVQMQFYEKGIRLVDRTPIYLSLLTDGTARNWEGLAQLDTRGFLLVTDSYPSTLLGFVALP
jgi:hypothetical protein